MKTRKAKLGVSCLLACLLLTGCVNINKATKLPRGNNQAVLVVPVQGEPVILVSHHLGVSVLTGPFDNAAEKGATQSARDKLAERLNRDAGDFKPEVVLAEECAQLLKNSPAPAFRGALLHESVLLPEEKKLLMNETSPFKAEELLVSKWGPLTNKWLKGPPVAVRNPGSAGASALLGLEVRFTWLQINHTSKIDAAAVVRLTDHATRKVIGVRYVSRDGHDIPPVTADSKPAVFKEDFRRLANEMAKDALTKMKLL